MAKVKPLTLSFEDRSRLETITKTRTLQAQTVTRARILLLKADGESIDAIAEKVGLNRNSVLLCLKKYNQGGIENATCLCRRSDMTLLEEEEMQKLLMMKKHGSLILPANVLVNLATQQKRGHMQS